MRVSLETTRLESGRELPLLAGQAGSPSGDLEPDPELIYDQLVSHAWECRICWAWRNQLWAVHRLCPTGAGLADRYAVAEARMRESQ